MVDKLDKNNFEFKYSKVKPFFSFNTCDKPDKRLFELWKQEYLINDISFDSISLNINDFYTIVVNCKLNEIQYLQLYDKKNNLYRYYYVNDVIKVGINNLFQYELIIDTYTSFILDFLEVNSNIKFKFLRTHKFYGPENKYEDDLLDNLPIFIKNYEFKIKEFLLENNIYKGESLGFEKKDDLYNANRYYVFYNDLGGVDCFPLLTQNSDINIYNLNYSKGELLHTFEYEWFSKILLDGTTIPYPQIPQNIYDTIVDNINQNNIVEYYGLKYISHGLVPNEDFWILINSFNVNPYLITNIIKYSKDYTTRWWYEADIYVGVKDDIKINHHTSSYTSVEELDYNISKNLSIRCKIYKNNKNGVNLLNLSSNSFKVLEEYKKSHANKFVGIYHGPHLLNLQAKNLKTKIFNNQNKNLMLNFITLDSINEFTTNNFTILDFKEYIAPIYTLNDLKTTNKNISPYFLKLINVKYFNNDINLYYYINLYDTLVTINGILFFTDCFNLFTNNKLLNNNQRIINYNYMLLNQNDKYQKYLNANRGVVEAGYNSFVKQIEFQKNNQIINSILGLFNLGGHQTTNSLYFSRYKTLKHLIGPSIGMNVGSGVIDSLKDTIMPILNSKMMINNYINNIKAQFKSMRTSLNNEFNFSSTSTSSLIYSYNSKQIKTQFEGVEIGNLDNDCINILNYSIYFFGYFFPKYDILKEKIINDRNKEFSYLLFDENYLSNISLFAFPNYFNNEIYEIVKQELKNGLRIWFEYPPNWEVENG